VESDDSQRQRPWRTGQSLLSDGLSYLPGERGDERLETIARTGLASNQRSASDPI
jgi:hypothetical protein